MQARSIGVIQQQIVTYAQTNYGTNLGQPLYYIWHDNNNNPITPSQTNIFILITFIVAFSINIFENVMSIFQSQIEATVAAAAPSTPQWTQNQILLFQYSATVPQIAQVLPNFTIGYPLVNPALRVINQCAVITQSNGVYIYKVALNGQPLTSSQLTSLAAYVNLLNPAGISAIAVSSMPDFVMVGATITYNGQYAPTIVASVTAVITKFLASIPFNGVLNISDLYVAIRAVPGVTDCIYSRLEIRANAVPPSGATQLVEGGDWITTEVGTFSGNAIPDTATGRTLADILTFQVQ